MQMDYKHFVPSLDHLINELKKWPGLGPKSANRLAAWLIKASSKDIQSLRQALHNIKTDIVKCTKCFNWTENSSICYLCQSPKRREDLLCVIEDPFDIAQIEASGTFNGRYHVLHGTLSPLHGVSPQDLTIKELIQRLKTSSIPIQEMILALDADIEGDMTALYITKQIKKEGIKTKITRLAHGIPFGGAIHYTDEQTLGKAMENRIEI